MLGQGSYVVLASEPVCICGVDVSAPHQLRGPPGRTFQQALADIRNELSDDEVSQRLGGP